MCGTFLLMSLHQNTKWELCWLPRPRNSPMRQECQLPFAHLQSCLLLGCDMLLLGVIPEVLIKRGSRECDAKTGILVICCLSTSYFWSPFFIIHSLQRLKKKKAFQNKSFFFSFSDCLYWFIWRKPIIYWSFKLPLFLVILWDDLRSPTFKLLWGTPVYHRLHLWWRGKHFEAEGTAREKPGAEDLGVSEEVNGSTGLEVRVEKGWSGLAENDTGEKGRCQGIKGLWNKLRNVDLILTVKRGYQRV